MPREVRFGCHVSGNTKLRCYPTGFAFDTNHIGDSPEVVEEVKRIRQVVEDEWDAHGIPVHSRRQTRTTISTPSQEDDDDDLQPQN